MAHLFNMPHVNQLKRKSRCASCDLNEYRSIKDSLKRSGSLEKSSSHALVSNP